MDKLVSRCENRITLLLQRINFSLAAVVCLRVITSESIFVNILEAKSKVSPIKTVATPRLELCAAKLLIQLTENIKNSLNIYVLSWIRKPSSTWIVYIANRVADIQRLSNHLQWRYVPSNLNSADCAREAG